MRHFAHERGVNDLTIESAGLDAYHVGEAPDQRSQEEARKHGVDLSGQRARQVVPEDYERFDYILGMDDIHIEILKGECPGNYQERIGLLTDFAPQLGITTVPDPYYGGGNGFERVYFLVEASIQGLLDDIEFRRRES